MPEQGVAILVQAAVVVLRGDVEASGQRLHVGQHVGFVRQLHQGVGVLPGHRQRAARAVVLERAREQPALVGQQGAGDAVAGQALVGGALEVEADRAVAIDQQAQRGRQAEIGTHALTS